MGWLTKFILSVGEVKKPEVYDFSPDPSEQKIGIHLISNCGGEYEFISEDLTAEFIASQVNGLDWELGFYQLICTTEIGVSMEVGGSLNGVDGLSAMYRNRSQQIETLIEPPPETQKEMIEILQSFVAGTDEWHTKYSWK